MAKTKAKTTRHLPRRGFGAPTITPKLIVRDMSKQTERLGSNTDHNVRIHRALWDKEFLTQPKAPFFGEERLYINDGIPLSVFDGFGAVANPHLTYTVDDHIFHAQCGMWELSVQHQSIGDQIDFQFMVDAGSAHSFHPRSAQKRILDHHSPEVYSRWRRHVRMRFDECAPQLIAACKEALPTLRAYSITCCDSSERLMRSLDDVIVRDRIAYLVW